MNTGIESGSVILEHVSKAYRDDGHEVRALEDISAGFGQGRLALLLGPSGSGKTTLLTLIAGFVRPTSGGLSVLGMQPEALSHASLQLFRATKMGFVFQNFLLLDWLTVEENVALVGRFGRIDSPRSAARSALEKVGILHLADRYPASLSQGEKQRAAIARACVNNPLLLLADEPTACLESNQGFEIIKILHSIAKDESRCVIAASHDLRLIDYADDIFRLEDGVLRKETKVSRPDLSSAEHLQSRDKKSSAARDFLARP